MSASSSAAAIGRALGVLDHVHGGVFVVDELDLEAATRDADAEWGVVVDVGGVAVGIEETDAGGHDGWMTRRGVRRRRRRRRRGRAREWERADDGRSDGEATRAGFVDRVFFVSGARMRSGRDGVQSHEGVDHDAVEQFAVRWRREWAARLGLDRRIA